MSNIEIYKTKDGITEIDVKLDKETVWLTQKQMAELFDRDRTVITKHINNVFEEGEVSEKEGCAKIAHTTKHGAIKGKEQIHEVNHYNLDVIISVGYRVKSQRGTDFRKWATSRLKEYLVQGYALNIKKLKEQQEKMQELLGFVNNLKKSPNLIESKGLLKIISDYYNALVLLDNYDNGNVVQKNEIKEKHELTLDEAYSVVNSLKQKFPEDTLFGTEKDKSFESAIQSTYQTFGGEELYPSVESKAAHLLYSITKNHAFSDGNKRIASTVFLHYLDKNSLLYTDNGKKRIEENTMCALTLMVAESSANEKEVIESVITNLINMNEPVLKNA